MPRKTAERKFIGLVKRFAGRVDVMDKNWHIEITEYKLYLFGRLIKRYTKEKKVYH